MYATFQRTILFVAAFTVPLQSTSWRVGPTAVSATKAAVVLLVVLVAMQLLSPSHRRLPRDRSLPMLALFAVSVVISGFINVAYGHPPLRALFAASLFVGMIILYLALLVSIRSRAELVAVLWGLVLGAATAGFPALLAARSGTLFAPGDRFAGLAGQANLLAYELAIAIPIVVGLYFAARSYFAKLVLLGVGAIILLAIIGSLSRSAFAALFVMWAIWLIRSGRFDTLKYVLPAVAIALVLFALLPVEVHDRMATILDPAQRQHDRGTHGRMIQAEWALRAFLSNPIAGVGTANFLPWVKTQPGGYMLDVTMHNSYLYLLATHGLLGLVPFLALHVYAWRDYSAVRRLSAAWRHRGDPNLSELGVYALFLQLALVGAFIGGQAHQESDSKGLWICLALSAAILNLARKRVAELETSPVAHPTQSARSSAYGPAPDVVAATG
jgi:O-antigen ligase